MCHGSNIAARAIVVAALLLSAGCYSYRVAFPAGVGNSLEPVRQHKWSYAWGFAQGNTYDPPSCPTHRLAEMTVRTNLAYALVTVLSLGFATPVELEWRCAPPPQTATGFH